MTAYRQRLFVGSSTEALPLARALQDNLGRDMDVRVWDQGVFGLSSYALDDLLAQAETGDFAALVLQADDLIVSRGTAHAAVRDNVLLELGLFVGHFGRSRTFLVAPHGAGAPTLPSDVLGLTPASYAPPRDPADLPSSLGTAANQIRTAVASQDPPRHFAGTRPLRVQSRFNARDQRVIRPFLVPPSRDATLVHLTWPEFGAGVDKLVHQIRNHGGQLNAAAAIGINDAGLLIATLLNSACLNRAKLGYIRTRRTRQGLVIEPETFLPELSKDPTLLVCDFEVKHGDVLEVIAERLTTQYGDPDLHFATFGALTDNVDTGTDNLDQLRAAGVINELRLNMFVAALMHWPGIEPPLGLA